MPDRASTAAVIYRWRLEPGRETEFREAWRRATHAIRERYGSRGSRLHRADDGTWLAYAVWPSRARWETFQKEPSPDPEGSERMQACIAESLPTLHLAVEDDLLV